MKNTMNATKMDSQIARAYRFGSLVLCTVRGSHVEPVIARDDLDARHAVEFLAGLGLVTSWCRPRASGGGWSVLTPGSAMMLAAQSNTRPCPTCFALHTVSECPNR